jgi:hypothetical protein
LNSATPEYKPRDLPLQPNVSVDVYVPSDKSVLKKETGKNTEIERLLIQVQCI